jgi:hypothetical protein
MNLEEPDERPRMGKRAEGLSDRRRRICLSFRVCRSLFMRRDITLGVRDFDQHECLLL